MAAFRQPVLESRFSEDDANALPIRCSLAQVKSPLA